MEDNWERSLPFVKISLNDVKRLFKGILNSQDISSVTLIERGCRTTNYIVETINNHKYLLKIFFPKNQSYNKEIKLFHMIRDNVAIQKIYKVDSDEAIENRHYAIYEYLNGKTVGEYLKTGDIIDNSLIKSVANVLGKIHNYKFDRPGLFNEDLIIQERELPLSQRYETVIGNNAVLRLGKEVINKINNVVQANENKLAELDKEFRLIHGDFQGTNILVENNEVRGILDWEFSRAGCPLVDVGQFFRYEEYFNYESIRIFEKEYTRVCSYKLKDDWYKMSKLVDLISLIQLINQDGEMPNKYTQVKNIIIKTLDKF